MKKLILLILLLPLLVTAQSNYYISPTGNNDTGNGSIGNPWFSIGYASTQLSAGDTLFVKGGTYDYDSQQTIAVSGTEGNEVVFINYPDEEPVFDFWSIDVSGDAPGSGITGIRVQYQNNLKFIGLHARRAWNIHTDNGAATAWWVGYSRSITFERCKADSIAGYGFFATHSANVYYNYCDVWWCADPQDEDPGNGGNGFINAGFSSVAVEYIPNPGPITSISDNVTHNMGQITQSFWIDRYPSVISFTFQDNGVQIEAVRHTTNWQIPGNWDFIKVSTGDTLTGVIPEVRGTMKDSIVYYQCRGWLNADQAFGAVGWKYTIYDQCWAFSNGLPEYGFTHGDQHGFKYGLISSPIDSIQNMVKNSISVYNGMHGFHENTKSRPNLRAYNNLAAYNGGYGFFASEIYINNREIAINRYNNNIAYNNLSQSLADMRIMDIAVHSYNTFDAPFTTITEGQKFLYSPEHANDSQFLAVPGSKEANFAIMTAPRQTDGSLPDLGDYWKLAPDSDLRNIGTDVGLPYYGERPDLGPFQMNYTEASDVSDLLILWNDYTFVPLYGLVTTTTIVNAYNEQWDSIANNLFLLKQIVEILTDTEITWDNTAFTPITFGMRAFAIRDAINNNNTVLFTNMDALYTAALTLPEISVIPDYNDVEVTMLSTPSPQQFVGLYNWNVGILVNNTELIFDIINLNYGE